MVFLKDDLLNKLRVLSEVGENKSYNLSNVVTCKDNKLYVNNANLSVFLYVSCEINFNFSVDLKDLYSVVKSFPAKSFNMIVDNSVLKIFSDSLKEQCVVSLNLIEKQLFLKDELSPLLSIADDLNELSSFLSISETTNSFSQFLIFNDNEIATTNGCIANLVRTKTNFGKILLPIKTLQYFTKYRFVSFSDCSDNVKFIDENGFVFVFKKYVYETVKCDSVWALFNTYKINDFLKLFEVPDEFYSFISDSELFADNKSGCKPIKLIINKDKLKIVAANNKGAYEKELQIISENIDDEITLLVNYNQFINLKVKYNKFYINMDKSFPVLLFDTDNSKHILTTMNS